MVKIELRMQKWIDGLPQKIILSALLPKKWLKVIYRMKHLI